MLPLQCIQKGSFSCQPIRFWARWPDDAESSSKTKKHEQNTEHSAALYHAESLIDQISIVIALSFYVAPMFSFSGAPKSIGCAKTAHDIIAEQDRLALAISSMSTMISEKNGLQMLRTFQRRVDDTLQRRRDELFGMTRRVDLSVRFDSNLCTREALKGFRIRIACFTR